MLSSSMSDTFLCQIVGRCGGGGVGGEGAARGGRERGSGQTKCIKREFIKIV